MKRDRAELAVRHLAGRQHGLVTAASIRALGMTDQAVLRSEYEGSFVRVAPDVLRIAAVESDDFEDLRAMWMQMCIDNPTCEDGDLVVSHLSAAEVHGLDMSVTSLHSFTSRNELTIRCSDVHVVVENLPPDDWSYVDDLPVTTPLRTVVDLCVDAEDESIIANVVLAALTKKMLTENEIRSATVDCAGLYGGDVIDRARAVFSAQSGASAE